MNVKIMATFAATMADAKKACIKAGAASVNIVAANARRLAQDNIERNFTLRNNFTKSSVLYTQCPKSVGRLSDIKSETGITERAGYMARQELGGVKKSPSGKNLIIPNTRARGGSNAKKVLQKYTFASVKKKTVRWPRRKGSKKSRLVAAAYSAYKIGGFIRMNDAFFAVKNFRKSREKVRFKLDEMLNLKHKATVTPKKEWLAPAAEAAASGMQEIYNSQMERL